MSVPMEVARELPVELLRLMGYARGAYAPREYTEAVTAKVAQLAGMYGIGARRPAQLRTPPPAAQAPPAIHEGQLSLLPSSGDLL